jgi:exopolysaccharide biosynthesis polyprenyl glycosylphosphotransferase
MRSQDLFLARVSAIRVIEMTRLSRAMAILGGITILLDRVVLLDLRVRHVASAAGISLLFLIVARSIYRSWLTGARARGRFRRRVVVLGADIEARRLVTLLATHKDLGVDVVGVIGDDASAAACDLASIRLGVLADAEELIDAADVTGVIVSPNGVPGDRLNLLIRHFQRRNLHVFVSTAITGIDARRVRALSLAHEPMLYVEAPTLARAQVAMKRVFDVVMSSIGLLVSSPIFLIVAVCIKISDRGPIFFRQQRVGRDGRLFQVIKFRTMVVNAEKQLAALSKQNERHGPLFKMVNDPRVTGLGRFLRRSSLDELPQLINVLKGEMSLVGPRPALPSEVEHFSIELRARERVLPGITGLWQVEARDNPSFEAYRRLDLFYVENWSITLDLLILLGTIEQFVVALLPFRRHPDEPTDSGVDTSWYDTAFAASADEPAVEPSDKLPVDAGSSHLAS